MMILVMALTAAATSSRLVGSQPRGNAVLRSARRDGTTTMPPKLAEHLQSLGLNANDFWARRAIQDKRVADRERLLHAVESDRQRAAAEQRLYDAVRAPAVRSDVRSESARLCRALAEARRLQVLQPQLVRKASALLALLERAAVEEHERRRTLGDRDNAAAESVRREALVHQLQSGTWAIDGSCAVPSSPSARRRLPRSGPRMAAPAELAPADDIENQPEPPEPQPSSGAFQAAGEQRLALVEEVLPKAAPGGYEARLRDAVAARGDVIRWAITQVGDETVTAEVVLLLPAEDPAS